MPVCRRYRAAPGTAGEKTRAMRYPAPATLLPDGAQAGFQNSF
ncbi:hypothetical protein [Komagataeibacter melomenusus]|nr:hypothetical protein [Komagataeibacter melomenusus]